MTTAFSGPLYSTGNMTYLETAIGGEPAPDYNPDASPSMMFMGTSTPDVRYILSSAKLQEYQGVQPQWRDLAQLESVNAVPAAFGAAKIAAAAHTLNNTAMTLVTTASAGISPKVPLLQWPQSAGANIANNAWGGGTVVVAPLMLDFGFAFGTTTLNSQIVTVANSANFTNGMPIVIAGAATGGAALCTYVTGLPSPTTITVANASTLAVTAGAIGTGNIWNGSGPNTPIVPTAALPYIACGPGLFFHGGQGLARGISITCNSASGTGGNFVVNGWDIYGQVMNETIAIAPGTALVAYGKKAFKAINTVTPKFTDATYTYSVGTSDVFGFNVYAERWELSDIDWAGASVTSSTGFTAGTTAALGDVRGTFQASAQGGGTGYGTTNSNGTVSSLVMTGNRLFMSNAPGLFSMLQANALAPATLVGAVQT